MAKKKPAAKKKASKVKVRVSKPKASQPETRDDGKRHLDMTELAGEAYTLHTPGEPRRHHGGHGRNTTSFSRSQPIELEHKLMIIDNLLSKMTAGVCCEDMSILAMHVTCWAAELTAVHEDVPDDKIQDAKIIFPTEPVLRLLNELQAFQARSSLSDDAIVDYLIMKMHGDVSKQSALLN